MEGRAAERATWASVWRYVAGLAVCLVLGWFAFALGTRVPLLGLVDLGFHELGHLVTYVFPDVVTAAMGSVTQVMVPLALAAYFLWRRQDLMGAGVCLAWAATATQDASVYIADAPFQRLELIGGEHDWAFVLGPEHLDALAMSGTIAAAVKTLGVLLLVAGIASCLTGLSRGHRPLTPPQRPAGRALETLPRAPLSK